MNVTFSIDPRNRRVISEADIKSDFKAVLRQVPADENLMGGISIVDSARDVRIVIGDDLEYLVPKLCLNALPNLLARKKVSFALYAFDEHVELEPTGKDIEISGTELTAVKFPRRDLLPALVSCAERFSEFLQKLRGKDKKWAAQTKTFIAAVKQARARLKAL